MDMRLKERDSSMADRILLTGGTGFLGTELAARLTGRPDTQVYVLVRAVNEEEAIHRLKGAWYHDKALYASIGKTCIPVTGDFTQIGLGLSEEDRNRLLEQVTTVIHAGAEIGFQKSRDDRGRFPNGLGQEFQHDLLRAQDDASRKDAGTADHDGPPEALDQDYEKDVQPL